MAAIATAVDFPVSRIESEVVRLRALMEKGQFAVALWDRKNRTIILGRDRVGICPLYYTEADGWLLWGSEIKALFSSGLVAARPDPKGIDLTLAGTLLRGIYTIQGDTLKVLYQRGDRPKNFINPTPGAAELTLVRDKP